MDAELELRLQYKVQFENGHFKLLGRHRVTVLKWSDTKIVGDGKTTMAVREIVPSVAFLLAEITHQPSHLRSCSFMSAYVSLARIAGAGRSVSGDTREVGREHVAYDRFISSGRPIIPALYRNDTAHAEELKRVADAYNKRRVKTKRGTRRPLNSSEKIYLPSWAEHAGFMKHSTSFKYADVDTDLIVDVTDRIKVYRFLLGEYCGALPLPGAFEAALEMKRAVLASRYEGRGDLVPSTEIWESLDRLGVIVRNKGKQVILLRGEPGSGKEIFGNAIHYGSVRAKDTGPQQLAVAGLHLDALRQILFGSVASKGGLVDGLLAKSEGGTLFLDEFDKASTDTERWDFASALLRVLESDEYYPVDAREPRAVGDVNWILAGAFPGLDERRERGGGGDRDDTRSLMPNDLWSRFTDQLRVRNPVSRPGYAKAMFIYWHLLETVRWLGAEEGILLKLRTDRTSAGVMARWLLTGHPRVRRQAQDKVIRPEGRILELAEKFEALLESKGIEMMMGLRRVGAGAGPLGQFGARTIRQASTTASRELRARLIEKLGGPGGDLDVTDIKEVLKRAEEVLEVAFLGV